MRTCGSRFIAGCVLLLTAASSAAQQPSAPASSRPVQPFTVISREGRRPLAASQVGDQVMVALDDLAQLFQLTVREDAVTGNVAVAYKGRSVLLTPGQALASANGRLVSLPSAPSRDGRRWLVPVEFVSRALAPIYDARLDVRKNSRLVLWGDVRVPRVSVREEAAGGQVRVTVDIAPRTAHAISQEANRLLIRFEADALDAMLPDVVPQGLLQAVRLGDPGTTLVLDLGPRFGSFRASLVPHEPNAELAIDLLAAAPDVPPAPRPPAPAPGAPLLPVPPLPPALRTIVIDPGHGGEETGATGAGGLAEKDITLALARRLKAGLEARLGVRVLLTREGDQAVPLDDRAALANNNKGDLFVSLHLNASLRKDVSGAQVYYLSADQAGEAARHAAMAGQSLPSLGGGTREVEMILWEMAQVRHLSDSATLAGAIEEQMRGKVRLNPRPVQQAPFRVLAGANMPAVLVEAGFLTNDEEAQQLASDAYQDTIVRTLLEAISRFRELRANPPAQPPAVPVPR